MCTSRHDHGSRPAATTGAIRSGRGAGWTVVGVALVLATLATPGWAGADLLSCKKAYEEQRYEVVLGRCGTTAREPLAWRAELATALELIGMANLVLGREQPARAAFCQLREIDADHRPVDPIYPQRFVAVFDAVRAGGCTPPLRITVEATASRQRAAVRVRLQGTAPAISRIGVFYRQPGDKLWRRELAPTAPATVVELPKVAPEAGELEVFATVLVSDSDAVARVGTADRPLRLARLIVVPPPPRPPRPPQKAPLWRRGWFWWGVASVTATVVIVAASVAATSPRGEHGSLGSSIQLPLRFTWR